MLNEELADLAIFAAVAGYAPQMGDPSAHHQQQMIGLGQQAIPQKTRYFNRSCRFRNARRDRRARAASRRA